MTLRYQLDNGMTVVFHAQHAARVAAFQVWVKVGSADEVTGQEGLAHLHEHMLFKGTAKRRPGEIARDIEAHGGEINAWTSFDQTVYHVVIASQFARIGLETLSDAVRHSTFDPTELEREIEVVCEEIKRADDTPARRASKDLFATAYHAHPYRRPVLGTQSSVRGFTREKVRAFYERHYAPANMVLVVTGDLTEGQVRAWVAELLGGDWGRPPFQGATERPSEPAVTEPRVVLRSDSVKESYLTLAFPIPELRHADTPALDVLAMIAGQGEASRLVVDLKRRRPLVNSVYSYAYTPKDAGLFMVSMTLPPETTAEALVEATSVLGELCRHAVSDDELATVQALVESESIYHRETVQGLARKLGYYEAAAGGLEEEERYYRRVASLDPKQLLDVTARYVDPSRAIVTALLPNDGALSEHQVHDALATMKRAVEGRRRYERVRPPAPSPARGATPSRPAQGNTVVERLPSGAQIIIREERAVPLFAVRAVFPGGLRYETPETNGLTALVSRVLARGTRRRDAEQLAALVDALQGSLGGSGGRNSLSLRGDFLSKYFEQGFYLFAEVLLTPAFADREVQRERELLAQELATREDKPSAIAFELFARALYTAHPYRLNPLGELASLERLNDAALRAYHAGHMDPSQLTLCVVGDVPAERVLERARALFGQKSSKVEPPPAVPAEPPVTGPRVLRKTLARAQAHLVLGFLGARVTEPWRRHLEVLSMVLSGQGGRLFVELRDKRSMAYSVSSLSVEGVDPGHFAVYMGTSPDKLEAALEGIRRELTRLREELIPDDELIRAKEHLIGSHEIGLQRHGARAALMALDACYGLGADSFLNYAAEISAVTAEDIRDVARRVIDFDREALAIVGP